MKAKSILSAGLSLMVLGASSIPGFSQHEGAQTKQTRQSFQTLANGIYFYGQSRLLEQVGYYYFLLRKTGNTVIGMTYTGNETTDCFKGTAASNTIINVTVAEYELGSGSGWQFSQIRTPIDLSKFYRIESEKAQAGAIAQLQECVGVFANRR